MTLSEERRDRLQALKDVSGLIATKNFSGSSYRSTAELLTLADWVMYANGPELIELDSDDNDERPLAIIHEIAEDGLPDMDELEGQVAFIYDGSIVSGWPIQSDAMEGTLWSASHDVGRPGPFSGVTHWVEFTVPLAEITL